MSATPRIHARLTVDEHGNTLLIEEPEPAETPDLDPYEQAVREYKMAALDASYGRDGAKERLEVAEAVLESLERGRRRRQAAEEAALIRSREEAAARREAERAEAERLQLEARQELDLVEPRLEAAAREFGKLAADAMSIGIRAYSGTAANRAGQVAASLKVAVFEAMAGSPGNVREWLMRELGGRPSARERGL